MKIRRTKNLLYIFSSVMVLGLALISFDAPKPAEQTVALPTPTPTAKANTPTLAPTKSPEHTATPTPTPSSTPTPTLSPTPTPSLAQLNAAIAIRPADDETGAGLTTVLTDYLTNYYKDETLQVKEINNITCYYKEGLADITYFVYVTYDITYEGSNVPIPTLEEYLVSVEGGTVSVHTTSEDTDVKEALVLSRGSESVSELYIKELLRCYMNAKLAVDEALLASMVTDPSYLNMENIRKKTEYIEGYTNLKYLIYKAPEEVTEFDYLVFLANDSKIVNISTLAAGLEEFCITFDDNNYPYIFYGITSTTTDIFRRSVRSEKTYEDFVITNVVVPLDNAMDNDPDLKEFINRINSATGEN